VLRSDLEIRIPARPGGLHVDEDMREAGLHLVRQANNARLLDQIVALAPPPARLLDVGCGPGFLLEQARARGYDAEGVEPDANTVVAARRTGAPVRQGYFPEALAADTRFDVIVFNDVLEHIPDAFGAVRASAERLQPGGLLCLNCPDRRGLFFRTAAGLDRLGLSGAYDRLWQRGLPSPHIWYFAPSDLRRLAHGGGLRPVGELRLETLRLAGLWSRIRCERAASLPLSIAAYLFALVVYPFIRFAPPDAVAGFFRKAAIQ
jgi:SAM-dependent methyltransferase